MALLVCVVSVQFFNLFVGWKPPKPQILSNKHLDIYDSCWRFDWCYCGNSQSGNSPQRRFSRSHSPRAGLATGSFPARLMCFDTISCYNTHFIQFTLSKPCLQTFIQPVVPAHALVTGSAQAEPIGKHSMRGKRCRCCMDPVHPWLSPHFGVLHKSHTVSCIYQNHLVCGFVQVREN